MKRYRVRSGRQTFASKGPDLLRPRGLARQKLAGLLVDKPPRLYVKAGNREWEQVGGRVRVMEAWDEFRGSEFRVALRRSGKLEVVAATRAEGVRGLDLANSSPATELAWSLLKAQFPDLLFGGAYVWKMSNSTDWSDHAWGTAVDGTENPQKGISNDRVTDWVARMGAASSLSFDYALGSRRGSVVSVDPDGDVRPSGAASSHKWHVHLSVVDHDGRKPPRTGGVW